MFAGLGFKILTAFTYSAFKLHLDTAVMRFTQYSLLGMIILIFIGGCLGPVRDLYPEEKEKRPVSIYVVQPGWHVGIAFKGVHLRNKLPDHEKLPKTDFLMVGWGDNKYYPADRAGVGLFLRAAFLPTGSVIHVTGFSQSPDSYFTESGIVRLQVSEKGMKAMTDYIANRSLMMLKIICSSPRMAFIQKALSLKRKEFISFQKPPTNGQHGYCGKAVSPSRHFLP